MNIPGIEGKLAAHAASLRYESVGGDPCVALCRLWLDHLSVVLAGRGDPDCLRIAHAFAYPASSGNCSVIGETQRFAPGVAAFANGVLAHWYDWDDTHDASHVHGGSVIFPALLAAAEHAGLDTAGREFSTACIAAFDIACRVGLLLKVNGHRGWMPTGSGGSIGAAAGAARLLGLDERGIRSAMGLAAASSGLSRQALADRLNGKNILAGVAAKTAVESALLAKAGAEGARDFLTGIYGLQELHAGGRGDAASVAAGLGSTFSIVQVSVKPYPSCRSTHAVLDLAFDLLSKQPQAGGAVRAVRLVVPQGVFERCGMPFSPGENPRIAAQFSLPFTVALALRAGRITTADFSPAAVMTHFGELGDLIRNVSVVAEASAADADDVLTPVAAEFLMAGGNSVRMRGTQIKGAPDRPMSSAEAREKLSLAGGKELGDVQRAKLLLASADLHEAGPRGAIDIMQSSAMEPVASL